MPKILPPRAPKITGMTTVRLDVTPRGWALMRRESRVVFFACLCDLPRTEEVRITPTSVVIYIACTELNVAAFELHILEHVNEALRIAELEADKGP